ncbi:hypothetical protein ABTX81_04790 [Kitasatospora sp. NPDC097605]|uniref:hypothetical protein n=1 Tax=Kitasatospora sp. NPDC097605 TaxID=3157226 RepID=UPI00331666CD
MSRKNSTPTYQPHIGEVVRDLGHRDFTGQPVEGVYMDTLTGLVYLRPLAGGCEWTTKPEAVQPLPSPRFVSVQHPSRPRTADVA